MTLSNFAAGLEILRQHFRNQDGYELGAEHDVIYVFATETPLSTEEVTRLVKLGWFQEASEHDTKTGEFRVEHYNPENGWAAYV